MISKDVKVKMLQTKIIKAENKGTNTNGVVRRWKREIRNLQK